MIPYSDSVRSRTFPFVNLAIIGLCVVVFAAELMMTQRDLASFIVDWGTRPKLVSDAIRDPANGDAQVWATLFTAMFLHGSLLHLGGNMLFLWVFGDNVEDAVGHFRYLLFYLVCGLAATFTQIAFDTGSRVPTIGASGAISGVLGGYLLLYPNARVKLLIPIYFIPFAAYASAATVLLLWFVIQMVSGAVAVMEVDGGQTGVAWFAHIGGFVAGVVIVAAAGGKRLARG